MEIALLLAVYCVLIAAASIFGGWLPRLVQMTHLRTQLIISFVAGLMLAIATYQLLPHAFEILGSASLTGAAVLGGILAMFLMLRMFHTHTHAGSPLRVDAEDRVFDANGHSPEQHHSHDHDHHHDHHHDHDHHHVHGANCSHADHDNERGFGWIGMLVGLGIHSLMDGMALAASVAADAQHGAWLGLMGLGTLIAVALHKPLDAFAITSTMQASGWSKRHCSIANLLFSVISPIGVVLFYLGATQAGMPQWVIGIGLALSAGFFICIALSDLLPEVHFHSHDRLSLTTTLFLGVTVAIIVENLPGHSHSHAPEIQQPLPQPAQRLDDAAANESAANEAAANDSSLTD